MSEFEKDHVRLKIYAEFLINKCRVGNHRCTIDKLYENDQIFFLQSSVLLSLFSLTNTLADSRKHFSRDQITRKIACSFQIDLQLLF